MKELHAKMTKAAMSRIWVGILFIGLAVLFLVVGFNEEMKYLTASENLFNMNTYSMRSVSSGSDTIPAFYTFEGNMLLDYYGSDDEGYYYIMPTLDGKYMGCFVYNSDKSIADQIVEESYKYWSGETEAEPTTFLKGKGYVYDMGDNEAQYFKEYFEEAGAGASVMAALEYKTFVLTPFGKVIDFSDAFIMLLGVVFAICGIVYIGGFLTGAYKKQPAKYMAEYHLSESEVVSDLTYAIHRKNMDIGKRYVMLYADSSKLLAYEQMLWCYVSITKTKHRTNGIPTGTTYTYQVFFVMRDKKKHTLNVKTEAEGQEIVSTISEMAPHVICGYHKELDAMVKSNFAQLIKIVDDHKAELASEANSAAIPEEDIKPDSVSMSDFALKGEGAAGQDEAASAMDNSQDAYGAGSTDSYGSSSSAFGDDYDSGSYGGSSQSGLDAATFGGASSGFKLKDK
ncbi:MAG: hypothetical protein K2G89_00985 [Lachnospiraceae bacterium]|nr:hypothetical protein [Lachnospiraceae bacterium]